MASLAVCIEALRLASEMLESLILGLRRAFEYGVWWDGNTPTDKEQTPAPDL